MRFIALAAPALAALTAGFAVVAPAGAAAPRATILPGHWEYSYTIGIIPAGSEDKCIKPADAAQFSKGICTRRYKCDYTTNQVDDGKIQLKGTWTDKKGRVAPVSAKGSYTPESFKLDIKLKTVNGLPLAGVMNAKRLGATCPADAK
ncbi:DUF3617 domain-containing protein [Caulobacter hibisci]|uniref:DUF3617 family protein n=1 Tax=Caulobacter hibisci TaxID=2035993 RepID=A0ABS0SRD4_9CAUL|nr:DUF3617 family protein [Caulobacter hibisci]MBI1682160.1 DUF3617 family protein [Caulobacter hibisci]